MVVAREGAEGRKYLFYVFIFWHGESQAPGKPSNG